MSRERQPIEAVLREKGYIVISTAGRSMAPMLRDRRDTVEIHASAGPFRKYDAVLFRKDGSLVLHRIIKTVEGGYRIRGDNAAEEDFVRPEDILGILCAFTRNGRRYSVKNKGYILYVHLTVFFHPLQQLLRWMRRGVRRLLR